jgi:hypothetical protein
MLSVSERQVFFVGNCLVENGKGKQTQVIGGIVWISPTFSVTQ